MPITRNTTKAAKAAKKKLATKGKRYSPAEKEKAPDFVEKVNAEKGRGGVTTASKKFGVTALTVSNWLKKAGGEVKATPKAAGRPTMQKSTDVLDQLVALRDEIRGLEGQLAAKKVPSDRVKAKL